jgi:hypothetical protein
LEAALALSDQSSSKGSSQEENQNYEKEYDMLKRALNEMQITAQQAIDGNMENEINSSDEETKEESIQQDKE